MEIETEANPSSFLQGAGLVILALGLVVFSIGIILGSGLIAGLAIPVTVAGGFMMVWGM
jgi:hypothetical protein